MAVARFPPMLQTYNSLSFSNFEQSIILLKYKHEKFPKKLVDSKLKFFAKYLMFFAGNCLICRNVYKCKQIGGQLG